MEHPMHLLALPYELRDMIWAASAATGDANGLMRCCLQTRDEFSRHCKIPKGVTGLAKLVIWVDSTYIQGSWLKFEYCWEAHGNTYRAIDTVRDLNDPVAQRLLEMTNADTIVVHLQAPRRGHFVGALMMMLAKADDAYHLISNMAYPSSITIRFSTEGVQPGQSKKEAKNFWECRATKALEESIRKHISGHDRLMPCFYEYFLNNHPVTFARPPMFEFMTWPRIHVHMPSGIKFSPEDVRYIVKEQGPNALLEILARHRNLRDDISWYSAEMMTDKRKLAHPYHSMRSYWEAIDYGVANLKYRYQFLLDNMAGPVGGCLDMLRLHRFRTMGGNKANFFAREEQTGMTTFASLSGAASEMTNRLKILFNPLACEETRGLRTRCPHLRAVNWATDPSAIASPRQYCPPSAWLENYPNGIRYNWKRRNIAKWRFQWSTLSGPDWSHPEIIWLERWWDCLACCEESSGAMETLSLHFERKVLRNWYSFFHDPPHNNVTPSYCECDDCWEDYWYGRAVMVRRECIRQVWSTPSRSDFSHVGYRCLAKECRVWSKGVTRDATLEWNLRACPQDCGCCRLVRRDGCPSCGFGG